MWGVPMAQSTVMSVGASGGLVDEAAVYSCTGSPKPSDIEILVKWLLNEDFSSAYRHIVGLQQSKGLALLDITRELAPYVYLYTPLLLPALCSSMIYHN